MSPQDDGVRRRRGPFAVGRREVDRVPGLDASVRGVDELELVFVAADLRERPVIRPEHVTPQFEERLNLLGEGAVRVGGDVVDVSKETVALFENLSLVMTLGDVAEVHRIGLGG